MPITLLITGANRGIGLALTEAAVSRGDTVIATARRPEQAKELHSLSALTGRVEVEALDVTEEASASALADRLAGRSLDLLVANAGVLNSYGALDDPAHDAAAWQAVLMTNIFGPFVTVRTFRHLLKQASPGKIAIISSNMGSTTRAANRGAAYPYCASKAAATNLAVNLSAELAGEGIAIGAYHPGWVRTGMGGASADISVQQSAEGLLKRFDALSLATTGVLEDYQGRPLSY